jgi:hypothetical protein
MANFRAPYVSAVNRRFPVRPFFAGLGSVYGSGVYAVYGSGVYSIYGSGGYVATAPRVVAYAPPDVVIAPAYDWTKDPAKLAMIAAARNADSTSAAAQNNAAMVQSPSVFSNHKLLWGVAAAIAVAVGGTYIFSKI